MDSTRTPDRWASTPPAELLAAAWLAGYSLPGRGARIGR